MHDRAAAASSAEDAEAAPDIQIHGLSVECFFVATVEEALRASRRPNGTVRLSTAKRVRDGGMDVIPTGNTPHATIWLPRPLDEVVWLRLQQVFDPPIANRYARRRLR
jgi:hypothetical protein